MHPENEQAMQLRPDAWEKAVDSADAEASASVNMMLALHDIANGRSELPQASIDELTEKASDLIPDLVAAINDWTKGCSPASAVPANTNQRLVAAKKIGRNDLCPVGQGANTRDAAQPIKQGHSQVSAVL